MTLVDTSIWIDHFRVGAGGLESLLNKNQVLTHPFVIGELACGNLRQRVNVLRMLQNLPQAPIASDGEVLTFINNSELMGRGIGFIDAHLLAATALADDARIWTADKRLEKQAARLDLIHTD